MQFNCRIIRVPWVAAAIALSVLAATSEAQEEEERQGKELFDHDKQHCKDVSIWGEVQYKPAGRTESIQ